MAKLLLLCVLLIYAVGEMGVNSECCPNHFFKCNDGSDTPLCCGTRTCNFFCCGCKCRRARDKRDVTGLESPNGFKVIDKNENGHIDKEEAHSHLLSGRCGNFTGDFAELENHFAKFDLDGDGKLSYAEINAAG